MKTNSKLNKYLRFIWLFCILLSFEVTPGYCASSARERFSPVWHQKVTEHFKILYQKDLLDVEAAYKELSKELNLALDHRLTVYITGNLKRRSVAREYQSYYEPKKHKIVVSNIRQLRHELTHALFYTLSKNTPSILEEGIATYKETNTYPEATMGLNSVVDNFNSNKRELIGYADYAAAQAWVGNLIEGCGIAKFKELYKRAKDVNSFKRSYEEIYGGYEIQTSSVPIKKETDAPFIARQGTSSQILCRLSQNRSAPYIMDDTAIKGDWHFEETTHFSVRFLNNCYIDVEALYNWASRKFGKELKDRVSIFILKEAGGESWSQIDGEGRYLIWASDKKAIEHHLAHILFVQNGEVIPEGALPTH